MDKITGISVFVQVADSGSYVAAGRVLGQTASSVGKTIVRLEEKLGVRLFHRNTRSISLTSEGSRFLERCRAIMRDINAAEEDIAHSRESPRGRIRVSLPLVNDQLNATFLGFMTAYPDIELDLNYTNRKVDLIEEGFDVVIRIGQLQDSSLRVRRIGSFRLMLVASPAYLERHGTPKTLDELSQHLCLRTRNASTCKLYDWPLGEDYARHSEQLRSRLVADHNAMLLSAALLGHGIACLPEFWVKREVESGELRTVLENETINSRNVSAVWPAEGSSSPKLTKFLDYIAAELPAVLGNGATRKTRNANERSGTNLAVIRAVKD
jgi:DNA-binding transcriptional LysR family regulator